VLTKQDLLDNFSNVTEIGHHAFKCLETTKISTYYYYVYIASENSCQSDFLIVAEDMENDDFACAIFGAIKDLGIPPQLAISPAPQNPYGFSSILLAQKDFHAHFKGILDDKRQALTLCIPIHRCEFSGYETAQEFMLMRRDIVPTMNWDREICPKTILRFDNPKTQSGTGDTEILVRQDALLREIENIEGVPSGFIEVINYSGQIVEILSPSLGTYIFIRSRDDDSRESLTKPILLIKLHSFLIS